MDWREQEGAGFQYRIVRKETVAVVQEVSDEQMERNEQIQKYLGSRVEGWLTGWKDQTNIFWLPKR